MDIDRTAMDTSSRYVESVTADGDGAVERGELIDTEEKPNKVSKIRWRCQIHRKVAHVRNTCAVSDRIDSKLIRLALNVQREPNGNMRLRREMRGLIVEQFVSNLGGRNSAEVEERRDAVFELFFDSDTPLDAKRSHIIRSLFNADISIVGEVSHNENGCCRSSAHTLALMLHVGVPAILPIALPVAQRSDWTGMKQASQEVGIGMNIHG